MKSLVLYAMKSLCYIKFIKSKNYLSKKKKKNSTNEYNLEVVVGLARLSNRKSCTSWKLVSW